MRFTALMAFGAVIGLVMFPGAPRQLVLLVQGHTDKAVLIRCLEIAPASEEEPTGYRWFVNYVDGHGRHHTEVALRATEIHYPGRGKRVRIVYKPSDPSWAARVSMFDIGGFAVTVWIFLGVAVTVVQATYGGR